MEQQLVPGALLNVPKSTPFSLSGAGGIAVVESDSDGEFPASAQNSSDEEESDDDEAEFFDAVDRKAIAPVRIKKSSMLESSMMRSTREGPPVKSALKGSTMMGKSGMR